MCLLNVQGLIGKQYNKRDCEETKYLFNTYNILLFTETWSNDLFNYEVDNFYSYILHRKNMVKKSKRSSGGFMIYIHNKFKKIC